MATTAQCQNIQEEIEINNTFAYHLKQNYLFINFNCSLIVF